MKLSVVKVVNGSFAIISEHGSEVGAIVAFHDNCKIHWNANDVLDATIAILDENLDHFKGYKEHIVHELPEKIEDLEVLEDEEDLDEDIE